MDRNCTSCNRRFKKAGKYTYKYKIANYASPKTAKLILPTVGDYGKAICQSCKIILLRGQSRGIKRDLEAVDNPTPGCSITPHQSPKRHNGSASPVQNNLVTWQVNIYYSHVQSAFT